MQPGSARSEWEVLTATAHLPEAQALIGRGISRGEIRVAPAPGGGIRIIPADCTGPVAGPERAVALELEKNRRREPVLRIERRGR